MTDEQFVTARLQTLEPAGAWTTHPAAAWQQLQGRRQRRNLWTTLAFSTAALMLIAVPTPARCAITTLGCPRLLPAATVAPHDTNYKETGSSTAPLTIEIYSDYECPHCANFYNNLYPQFAAEFVKTGKVRVIHRDFPLPHFTYSKLAARYANAAGIAGHYEEAVTQLFKTQQEWAANGNIEAVLIRVLDPGTMQKIRNLVATDSSLDQTVATDLTAAAKNHITGTPTMVFIHNGQSQTATAPESYPLLRGYINQLLPH